jgi:hypothetical protein
MAALAYQQSQLSGVALLMPAASAGGDTFPVSDRGAFLVKNGSGSSINVTVDVPGNTQYGQAQPDVVVAVAAGATEIIGPFPAGLANATDGVVHVTYSAVTTVTVQPIQI